MSSFLKGPGEVITVRDPIEEPLPNFSPIPPSSASPENVPLLPQIDHELGRYFSISRQLETTLSELRANEKKTREELRQLQVRYSAHIFETENKLKEFAVREESMKVHLASCQQAGKGWKERATILTKEVENLHSNIAVLKKTAQSFHQREQSLKDLVQRSQATEKERGVQLSQVAQKYQLTHAKLQQFRPAWMKLSALYRAARDKIIKLEHHIKALDDERKSLKADLETIKNNTATFSQREEALKAALAEARKSENTLLEQGEKLAEELSRIRPELARYQAHWRKAKNADLQAQQVFKESASLKEELQKLNSDLKSAESAVMNERENARRMLEQAEKFRSSWEKEKRKKHEILRNFEMYKNCLEKTTQHLNASLSEEQEAKIKLMAELEQYKASLREAEEADVATQEIVEQSLEIKSQVSELSDALRGEKRLNEELREKLKKESTEKQIALNCLNETELRLTKLTREMDDSKNGALPNSFPEVHSIHLDI